MRRIILTTGLAIGVVALGACGESEAPPQSSDLANVLKPTQVTTFASPHLLDGYIDTLDKTFPSCVVPSGELAASVDAAQGEFTFDFIDSREELANKLDIDLSLRANLVLADVEAGFKFLDAFKSSNRSVLALVRAEQSYTVKFGNNTSSVSGLTFRRDENPANDPLTLLASNKQEDNDTFLARCGSHFVNGLVFKARLALAVRFDAPDIETAQAIRAGLGGGIKGGKSPGLPNTDADWCGGGSGTPADPNDPNAIPNAAAPPPEGLEEGGAGLAGVGITGKFKVAVEKCSKLKSVGITVSLLNEGYIPDTSNVDPINQLMAPLPGDPNAFLPPPQVDLNGLNGGQPQTELGVILDAFNKHQQSLVNSLRREACIDAPEGSNFPCPDGMQAGPGFFAPNHPGRFAVLRRATLASYQQLREAQALHPWDRMNQTLKSLDAYVKPIVRLQNKIDAYYGEDINPFLRAQKDAANRAAFGIKGPMAPVFSLTELRSRANTFAEKFYSPNSDELSVDTSLLVTALERCTDQAHQGLFAPCKADPTQTEEYKAAKADVDQYEQGRIRPLNVRAIAPRSWNSAQYECGKGMQLPRKQDVERLAVLVRDGVLPQSPKPTLTNAIWRAPETGDKWCPVFYNPSNGEAHSTDKCADGKGPEYPMTLPALCVPADGPIE